MMTNSGFIKRHYKSFLLFLGTCIVLLSLGFNAIVMPWYDKRFGQIYIQANDEKGLTPLDERVSGTFIKNTFDPTTAKEWLKNNFYWRLQASANNVTWYDANQFLNVGVLWDENNLSSKITLTLNTNGAPRSLYYRFDLACNASMKEYLLDSTMSLWTMVVPFENKTITVFFDWTDIKPLIQTGKVWFNHGIKTVNEQDYFWFRIQTVNRIAVGIVFVVDPTYGIIADNGIQTYEYDAQEGHYVDSIKVGSDDEYSYFAIVSTGDSGSENDGYVRTIKVNESTGAITNSLVDYLEYDNSDGYGPSICQVGDGMYAIAYCDAGASKQTVTTVSISSTGAVGNAVTDTQALSYDGIDASSRAHIMHVTGNIYVVAYTDVDGDGWLETVEITGAGTITNAVLDSEEFDGTDGWFPRMAQMDSGTIAVIYECYDTGAGSATARDGMLMTYNISDAGIITDTPADSYEYDTTLGRWPDIISVGGTIYVIAHEGSGNDGFVRSISIESTGDIGALIDFIEFDTGDGGFQTLYNISLNSVADRYVYAVTYQGGSGDGFVCTFDVDSNGNMPRTTYTDQLEYDTADTLWYTQLLHVYGFRWLIAHVGTGNDGFVRTTQIYINNPAVLSDESPSDSSVDVGLTPELSINVSDVGDMLDVEWWSNSSGSWAKFGDNNSVPSFGAISDSVIDAFEFDTEEAKNRGRIGVCRLNDSEYYATVAMGDDGGDNDGFLRTLHVWNSNGTIQKSVVEKYEYDNSDGDWANIQQIPGTDKYVIVYRDTASTKVTAVTVKISDVDGDITNSVIDTLQFTNDGIFIHMIPLTDNIFLVSYSEPAGTDDGWLESFWVNSSGTINDTVLDNEEFDGTYSNSPSLCKIDDDTVALSYISTSTSGDYTLMTYDVTADGLISDAPVDTWLYETNPYGFATVYIPQCIDKISGTVYSITYENNIMYMYTKTLNIADSGSITKSWIATNKITIYATVSFWDANFYTFMALDPDDASDGVGIMGIAGTGDDVGYNYDGWMHVWTVKTDGKLGPGLTDSFEYDTSSASQTANVLHIADDYFFVVFTDGDVDGRCKTVEIGLDNTKTLRQTNTNFSVENTKYWWSVNVSDGIQWTNQTYCFTTLAPAVGRIWKSLLTSTGTGGNASARFRQLLSLSGTGGNISVSIWRSIFSSSGTGGNVTARFKSLLSLSGNGGNNTIPWRSLFSSSGTGGNISIRIWKQLFTLSGTGGNATARFRSLFNISGTGGNVSRFRSLFLLSGTGGNGTARFRQLLSLSGTGGNNTVPWRSLFSSSGTGGNASARFRQLLSLSGTGGNISVSIWRSIFSSSGTGGNITTIFRSIFSSSGTGGNISISVWTELLNLSGTGGNITGDKLLFNISGTGGDITGNRSLFSLSGTGGDITGFRSLFSLSGTGGNISTVKPATPYNMNLLVINPNPGNGTHLTNYLESNTSGLTTSIDIFYENFTTPPAMIPGEYNLTVVGTSPSNGPNIQNVSPVYADAYNNLTGQPISGQLYTGQFLSGGDYCIVRSFLSFDTSSLPDEAVIDSMHVQLVVFDDYSDTDFRVSLQTVKPPVPHNPLIPTDYERHAFPVSATIGQRDTSGAVPDGYFNISINASGINDVNFTGYTYWVVRSNQDIIASAPVDDEWIGFYAPGGVHPEYGPRLIINYTIPSSNWQHIVNVTWEGRDNTVPWSTYAFSHVTVNGTATVPAINFSGIDTYFWHLEWESNKTNNGSSQIFTFTTVAGGGTGGPSFIMTQNDWTRFLLVGVLVSLIIMLVLTRRKRKQEEE